MERSEDDWEAARESETGSAEKPEGIEAAVVVSWMLDAEQSSGSRQRAGSPSEHC